MKNVYIDTGTIEVNKYFYYTQLIHEATKKKQKIYTWKLSIESKIVFL